MLLSQLFEMRSFGAAAGGAATGSSSAAAAKPVKSVQVDALVLLKIIQHAALETPDLVAGSLLGLPNEDGRVEVTHRCDISVRHAQQGLLSPLSLLRASVLYDYDWLTEPQKDCWLSTSRRADPRIVSARAFSSAALLVNAPRRKIND